MEKNVDLRQVKREIENMFKDKIDHLENIIATYEKVIQNKDDQLKRNTEQCRLRDQKIRELELEFLSFSEALESCDNTAVLQTLDKERHEFNYKIIEYENEIKRLNEQVKLGNLEEQKNLTQIQQLQNELKTKNCKRKEEAKSDNKKLITLKSEVDRQKIYITTLQNKLKGKGIKCNFPDLLSIQEENKSSKQRIADLEIQIEELNSKKESAEEHASTLEFEKNEASINLQKKTKELEVVKEEFINTQNEITQFKVLNEKYLSELTSQIHSNSASLLRKSEEIQNLEAELASKNLLIKSMEPQLSSQNQENQKLSEENHNIAELNSINEKQANELTLLVQKSEKEKQRMSKTIAKANKDRDKIMHENACIIKERANLQQELNAVLMQNEGLRNQIQEMRGDGRKYKQMTEEAIAQAFAEELKSLNQQNNKLAQQLYKVNQTERVNEGLLRQNKAFENEIKRLQEYLKGGGGGQAEYYALRVRQLEISLQNKTQEFNQIGAYLKQLEEQSSKQLEEAKMIIYQKNKELELYKSHHQNNNEKLLEDSQTSMHLKELRERDNYSTKKQLTHLNYNVHNHKTDFQEREREYLEAMSNLHKK